MPSDELPEDYRDPYLPAILAGQVFALVAENATGEAVDQLMSWGIPRSNAFAWVARRFPNGVYFPPPPPAMPCPYCGVPLKTDLARQCLECGMDWHDPKHVIKLGTNNA
jgi:hypothetical protein